VVNAFVRLRQIIEHHKDIAARMEKLERGYEQTASVIGILVEDIDQALRKIRVSTRTASHPATDATAFEPRGPCHPPPPKYQETFVRLAICKPH
jgi:hypothetical protein